MNTKLKMAYRIVEVPYVRFTGSNVDEVKSFVGEASSTMPKGEGYWFDNVGERWFLISNTIYIKNIAIQKTHISQD